jgi:transposase-like protein
MLTCGKNEQVVSETNRKHFSGEFKANVALDAIRGVKTVDEIGEEFGVLLPGRKSCKNRSLVLRMAFRTGFHLAE